MFVVARAFAVCAVPTMLSGCGTSPADFSPIAKRGSETALYAATDVAPRGAGATTRYRDIMRSPDGLFYTDALVNGVRIRFVVDSGSSLVVLSRKDARRAELDGAAQRELRVRTANGVVRMRGVTVHNLKIDGRSLGQVDAVIADGISGTSLLGQSALSRLDTVTFSGDRLQLR